MIERSKDITLLVEIAVREGQTEAFLAAVDALVKSVDANEPGCLRYDFYLSIDGRHDWNVETFRDSAAVIAHMENVRKLLPALAEVAVFTRIEVLGDLSEAGYEALGDLATGDHSLVGRIARQA